MRVVAGSAKGRRIEVPPDDSVRPTGERVREAVFNALYSAGGIAGAHVLDLFAGSGAMGIEALSRGAAHVTFVERSTGAIDVLRRNVDALELGDDATIVALDALTFLDTAGSFDVAILDPPYRFDRWADVLDRVHAEVIVVESDRVIPLGHSWESFKQGRYAATVVELARRADSSTEGPE
ncbi:MAG: 16S rRNA (guanine(966)-N(2))-methyltransferase RsmD [Acidimicrobiia bacterium]|nr:16S rRNA (guanine(966)-N(2))-methyltransferase RsmD [Acidimicrobiia bacterium]